MTWKAVPDDETEDGGKRLAGGSCKGARLELRTKQRYSQEELRSYGVQSTGFGTVENGGRVDVRKFWEFQIFNGCLGERCGY